MVSNTMLDLPDPDTPVKTTILFLGISSEMFFKLFCFKPIILIGSIIVPPFRKDSIFLFFKSKKSLKYIGKNIDIIKKRIKNRFSLKIE